MKSETLKITTAFNYDMKSHFKESAEDVKTQQRNSYEGFMGNPYVSKDALRRWLQEEAEDLQDPGYNFETTFLLLPFRCDTDDGEGVIPGQYLEVQCENGESKFIYCDNGGWNPEMTKGSCDDMV